MRREIQSIKPRNRVFTYMFVMCKYTAPYAKNAIQCQIVLVMQ